MDIKYYKMAANTKDFSKIIQPQEEDVIHAKRMILILMVGTSLANEHLEKAYIILIIDQNSRVKSGLVRDQDQASGGIQNEA